MYKAAHQYTIAVMITFTTCSYNTTTWHCVWGAHWHRGADRWIGGSSLLRTAPDYI